MQADVAKIAKALFKDIERAQAKLHEARVFPEPMAKISDGMVDMSYELGVVYGLSVGCALIGKFGREAALSALEGKPYPATLVVKALMDLVAMAVTTVTVEVEQRRDDRIQGIDAQLREAFADFAAKR